MHLEPHRIGPKSGNGCEHTSDRGKAPSLPGGFFYVPEFVSPAEEEHLLSKVNSAPRPRWKQLSNRRCVCADLASAMGRTCDRKGRVDC